MNSVSLIWMIGGGEGAALGASVLLLRRHVPESPRWLLLHGRALEAEEITSEIERHVARTHHGPLPEVHGRASLPCAACVMPASNFPAFCSGTVITITARHGPRCTAAGCLAFALPKMRIMSCWKTA